MYLLLFFFVLVDFFFKKITKTNKKIRKIDKIQKQIHKTPGIPWGAAFERRVARLGLSRDEFEAQWRATTLYNWRTTLEYAAYFGARDDTRRFLRFGAHPPPGSVRSDVAYESDDDDDDEESDESGDDENDPSYVPRMKTNADGEPRGRTVFACYVAGAPGSGKTTLVSLFCSI